MSNHDRRGWLRVMHHTAGERFTEDPIVALPTLVPREAPEAWCEGPWLRSILDFRWERPEHD